MPPLYNDNWSETDRQEWLHNYCLTYLQRDVNDLARLDRLEPFVRAQRIAAHRSAHCVNYADIARGADIAPATAKQFLHYLEISYQVALLPAWTRNPEKRLSKMPKLHFLDAGIRRAVIGKQGEMDGAEFESSIHAEVLKCIRNARLPWKMHHLRTADGREVDLILEHEKGLIAIECKKSMRVESADFRHLRDLEQIVDAPVLLKLVVSHDPKIVFQDIPPGPAVALPAPLIFQPFASP